MKNSLYTILTCLFIAGCANHDHTKLTQRLAELESENQKLKAQIENLKGPSQAEQNDVPKNYIKRRVENVDIYIPDMIDVQEATMEYTQDYEDMYAYLNVKVKNNLNRKINALLFQLKSVDCPETEWKYISKNASILPDSTGNVRVNMHIQLAEEYRMNCLQHSPIVKVSEALLETKERYLNIENMD